jgi:hypothetical protein
VKVIHYDEITLRAEELAAESGVAAEQVCALRKTELC